jgi:hypothetical protein
VDEACKFMIHAMVDFQWAFGTKQSLLLLMALTGGMKRLPVERRAEDGLSDAPPAPGEH